jgi:hypothetical protein
MESSLRIGKKRLEVAGLKKDICFVRAIVPDLPREVSRDNTRPSTKDFLHIVDDTKTGKPEGGSVALFRSYAVFSVAEAQIILGTCPHHRIGAGHHSKRVTMRHDEKRGKAHAAETQKHSSTQAGRRSTRIGKGSRKGYAGESRSQ